MASEVVVVVEDEDPGVASRGPFGRSSAAERPRDAPAHHDEIVALAGIDVRPPRPARRASSAPPPTSRRGFRGDRSRPAGSDREQGGPIARATGLERRLPPTVTSHPVQEITAGDGAVHSEVAIATIHKPSSSMLTRLFASLGERGPGSRSRFLPAGLASLAGVKRWYHTLFLAPFALRCYDVSFAKSLKASFRKMQASGSQVRRPPRLIHPTFENH